MEINADFIAIEAGAAAMRFQGAVYSQTAITAAAHAMSGRCHVHVEIDSPSDFVVRVRPKRSIDSVTDLAGELANTALDYVLRERLKAETEPVRNLLLAQAFSRVNLISPVTDRAEPEDDPLGAAKPDAR